MNKFIIAALLLIANAPSLLMALNNTKIDIKVSCGDCGDRDTDRNRN